MTGWTFPDLEPEFSPARAGVGSDSLEGILRLCRGRRRRAAEGGGSGGSIVPEEEPQRRKESWSPQGSGKGTPSNPSGGSNSLPSRSSDLKD